ncbi:MAG TPA: DUF3795 domain-containing protein [Spirochaetota bacterium]
MDIFQNTAPCGIDCFNCDVHENNITEKVKEALSAQYKIDKDKIACKGCRAMNGCRLHWNKCDTLDCVKAKGVDFCHECADFPCSMLMPVAEGAAHYPHNTKLYHLCRMKKIGLERWAEEAAISRKKYFKGKFIPGTGAVLD